MIAQSIAFQFKMGSIRRCFLLTISVLSVVWPIASSASSSTSSGNYGTPPTYAFQLDNQTASSPSKYIELSRLHLDRDQQPLLIHTSSGHALGVQRTMQLKASLVDEATGHFELKPDQSIAHKIDVFHGIPYARPPLDQLRFRPPQPSPGWPGYVFNATQPADACVQFPDLFFGNFEGSIMWNPVTPMHEDCLTVTVWLAERNNPNRLNLSGHPRRLLPVLVWIYGGGFYSGSTEIPAYDFGMFAALHQVIVIGINYRVASLGFFYTDSAEAPGNVGLLDQLMAMRWIKQNAQSFGGNPYQITLIGESAGAVSIGLHLRSPLSAGLFQRAILQSGGATCPFSTDSTENALWRSLMLAYRVGCLQAMGPKEAVVKQSNFTVQVNDISDEKATQRQSGSGQFADGEHKFEDELPAPESDLESHESDGDEPWKFEREVSLKQLKDWAERQGDRWMQCMRLINASELVEKEWHSLGLIQFPAIPVADGMYLAKRPQIGDSVSLNAGQTSLDLLVGSVTEESNFFLVYQLTEFLNLSEQVRVTRKQFEDTARRHFRKEDSLLVDAIVSAYTNWPDPDDTIANRDALEKMMGDSTFTCQVNEMAHR